MWALYSRRGRLDPVWSLHWREWEREGANVRGGGGEGGRTASAQIGSQAHQQQRQSIFLILVSRVFSCRSSVSLIEISLPAEVSRSLRQPSPPSTHFFCPSGARLFLAQLRGTVLPVLLLFIPVSWIFNGKWRSARSRTVFSASSQSKLYLSYASPRRQTGPTSSPSTTRKYPAPFGG